MIPYAVQVVVHNREEQEEHDTCMGQKGKDGIMNRQRQEMRRELGFYAIKTAAIKSENATN